METFLGSSNFQKCEISYDILLLCSTPTGKCYHRVIFHFIEWKAKVEEYGVTKE